MVQTEGSNVTLECVAVDKNNTGESLKPFPLILLVLLCECLLLLLEGESIGNFGAWDDPADFPDTCDYTNYGASMCGDQCIPQLKNCYCGSDKFKTYSEDKKHCCLPTGESCTRIENDRDKVTLLPGLSDFRGTAGACRQGITLSMSSICNTTMGVRCYNSYQHSLYIGGQSHFTCPDTCVPWESMCRGVSHCERDHWVCGPNLRCPSKYNDVNSRSSYDTQKINISSSLVDAHHYCLRDSKINDGKFDSVDRSDETQVRPAQSPLVLDIALFPKCIRMFNSTTGIYTSKMFNSSIGTELYTSGSDGPGIMCGKDCRLYTDWCRDDITASCDTGSGNIWSNDPSLCQDPRVFASASCYLYSSGKVSIYELRCTGQNMECVRPWYTVKDGRQGWVHQCPDKSDQVFNSSLTCREHLQQHIDFHTQKFCNANFTIFKGWQEGHVEIKSELICTNKTHWLSERDPSYSDPHSCQSSCSNRTLDCLACSNSSYFGCHKSGQCVHPDLVCDGHPQCVEGEDEDLSMCYDKFIKLKIIQPLAQLRCKSLFYENMYVFATPRNNKIECWDGFDEQEIVDYSTIILITSEVIIVTMYIALKYSGTAKRMLSADFQNIASNDNSDQNLQQNFLDYKTLKNYGKNHDLITDIENTNVHILNSIHSQKVEDNKFTCELFYHLEQQIHKSDESEIHLCLHKKMDPKVVDNILDSGEPGCTAGCIRKFEKIVGKRLIIELQNKITTSLIIKEITGTAIGIIKVIAKYVDLFKDTYLSIVLLQAIGSFESILYFKTSFSSVIVIAMFSSILIPLFLSTLHLIVNRRKIIDEENFSRTRKYVTTILCFITSALNPIILDAYYHELKEDIRKLLQKRDIRAMPMLRKCRKIKNQIVTFHKIELGRINLSIT